MRAFATALALAAVATGATLVIVSILESFEGRVLFTAIIEVFL